jgi:hypothetical protein
MNGNGKGGDSRGNKRKSSRRRDNSPNQRQENPRSNAKKTAESPRIGDGKFEKARGSLFERPRWTAPKAPSDPIPTPECPYCGQPIKDISSAISDRNSGSPVHFDCVLARISEDEPLEPGDAVSYIGGGRFGIIHFNNPPDTRDFKIKKILEWENKENRSEWRQLVSDHYSVT